MRLCFCVYTNAFYEEVGAELALQTYHVVRFKLGVLFSFFPKDILALLLLAGELH